MVAKVPNTGLSDLRKERQKTSFLKSIIYDMGSVLQKCWRSGLAWAEISSKKDFACQPLLVSKNIASWLSRSVIMHARIGRISIASLLLFCKAYTLTLPSYLVIPGLCDVVSQDMATFSQDVCHLLPLYHTWPGVTRRKHNEVANSRLCSRAVATAADWFSSHVWPDVIRPRHWAGTQLQAWPELIDHAFWPPDSMNITPIGRQTVIDPPI